MTVFSSVAVLLELYKEARMSHTIYHIRMHWCITYIQCIQAQNQDSMY